MNRMRVIRQLSSGVAGMFYRPSDDIAKEYHKWYYGSLTWMETSWMGVKCQKSPADMWNYQEILSELQPSLIVEFGSFCGGSALFFAGVLRQLGGRARVLSVDITHRWLDARARRDPDVTFLQSSSTDPAVAERIRALRADVSGPVFAILDSDHSRDHVLAEMTLLRPLLKTGDYLVVEDSNVNGHPVLPGFGPGPFEAIEAYEAEFPDDYIHDKHREAKFGWTFATNGFLIRT
jgi:cephalosporin hydroxylase